ncbi:MAG: hypothetical protein ACK4PI_10940 [Tepidisphaerales bacterium]
MKRSLLALAAAAAVVSSASVSSAFLIVSFEQNALQTEEVTYNVVAPATVPSLNSATGFLAPVGVRVTDFLGNVYPNVAISLGGLQAAAPAVSFFGTAAQPLGAGSFALLDLSNTTILLQGVMSDAILVGSSQTGSVTSASITYTGGSIYTAFLALGGIPFSGEMSFSLLNITPSVTVSGGNIDAFSASVNGQFQGVIPEPAALGLLAPAALLIARRRK